MTTTTTFQTSAGPCSVAAAEPVPGLHVYEIPSDVSPTSEHRWVLAHHEGVALAAFATEAAATTAAEAVADRTDWTRNAMTCANAIGLPGMTDLMNQLTTAGGWHPNA